MPKYDSIFLYGYFLLTQAYFFNRCILCSLSNLSVSNIADAYHACIDYVATDILTDICIGKCTLASSLVCYNQHAFVCIADIPTTNLLWNSYFLFQILSHYSNN